MIDVARSAAREAGHFIMEHYGRLEKEAIRRKSRNDFLSFVDENSEKLIVEIIHETFPDHDILAEEFGEIRKESRYRWIIDPLDGTTNYINTIPVFAVSIALETDGELTHGVVYDPVHDDMFYAEAGKGAFCNDKPIQVSGNEHLADSFIATGFPFKYKQHLPDFLLAFEGVFKEAIGARRLGAAAIDLAYVAAGRFDAFWELGLKPWDMAAGSVILKEAGGILTDFWNRPYYLHNSYLIASNGKIHQELMDKIQQVFPFYKPVTS